MLRTLWKWTLLGYMLLGSVGAGAQTDPLTEARQLVEQKDYEKAARTYEALYRQPPADAEIYKGYFDLLLLQKDYKAAERLAESQMQINPQEPLLMIDLGRVLLASKKEKKANEQFEKAVLLINGDDIRTTRMVNAFLELQQDQWAIKTYERAIEVIHNPYFYSTPLAKLYAKAGDMDKAVTIILSAGPMQMPGTDDAKTILLELLGTDAKKLQLTQKALIKRINEQPENTWFAEILTWLYTQKDDWEGALIQIQALDERNQENGARLLEFSRTAKREGKYAIALKALEGIMEQGKEQPMYAIARAEEMNILMEDLQQKATFSTEEVEAMEKKYELFFNEFPQYYNTETLRDYAMLEARYRHDLPKAIALLQTAIEKPGARRDFSGWAKLQLGDYYVLQGRIWDASLVYSQVDKAFREDVLGEEARFRNAKLAYYRGDFEWAQGQLSVLKASTSELIANDALYLSVLITENIPADSNLVPLERYAYADLLLFQNKDKEAEELLDSLSKAYPKHPLNDDILMLRAKMAAKHRDYKKALDYLEEVYTRYGEDVLADDAIFKTAEMYELQLKDKEKARRFYEKLILEFPGSTYVQTARQRFAALQMATPPLP